jgi:acyl-CoA synthetase (AMP-forming)/AMP-acid ligase II
VFRAYLHEPTETVQEKHPCYGYYTGAIFMDQGGYAQIKSNKEQNPPTEEEVRNDSLS